MHLASDLLLTIVAFIIASASESVVHFGLPFRILPGFLSAANLLVLCAIWGALIYREKASYIYRTKPFRQIMKEVLYVVVVGTVLFTFWLFATKYEVYDRSFFALFMAIDAVMLYGLRVFVLFMLHYLRSKGYNNQNVIIVGTGDSAKRAVDDLKAHPEWGFRVIGLLDWEDKTSLWRYRDIPLIGSLSQLPDIMQNGHVDYVIFAVGHEHLDKVDPSFAVCEEMGVQACLIADFFSTNKARKEITEFLGRPAVIYSTTTDRKVQIVAKSLLDRVGAALGLVLASPLMIAVAIVIRLTSRGPVLFRQERCGLNGRRFTVLKFRTMVQNAEELKASLIPLNEMDGAAFKIKDDPRITRIGKLLRKSSIDELPQLINVAKGQMSLVGPRPPVPDEVQQYDRWQRRKLSMKPGLTGLWQVGGRNNVSFDEWMKMDLKYIDNWSLWLDTKILLKTIPTVINATGK
jgi:exopolysaccharide biosynthesis polyprenyl glycosylphosphotransferase